MAKKSLRDTLRENQRGLDHYAKLYGKTQTQHIAVKPKREIKNHSDNKKTITSEHEEQCAFVSWFRRQYKGVRIFSVPNAAKRSDRLAAYLKSEGMTPGVPDLVILEWKMLIEMKRTIKYSISDPQKDWENYANEIGWVHIYGYGAEDAIEKVKEYVSRR